MASLAWRSSVVARKRLQANGQLRIAPKSKEKMRARLKELTARNRGRSLDRVVGELNRVTRGWIEYFKLAAAKKWRCDTDAWLRRRLRCLVETARCYCSGNEIC